MKTLLLAAVLSLSMGVAVAAEDNAKQVQGIQTNGASKVAFQNLRIETASDGTVALRGSLRRIGRDPVHFAHLDYTITDSNGKVLDTGRTDYSGAIKQRRPHGSSYFSIPLKQPWQSGSHRASIVWHNKPHQP